MRPHPLLPSPLCALEPSGPEEDGASPLPSAEKHDHVSKPVHKRTMTWPGEAVENKMSWRGLHGDHLLRVCVHAWLSLTRRFAIMPLVRAIIAKFVHKVVLPRSLWSSVCSSAKSMMTHWDPFPAQVTSSYDVPTSPDAAATTWRRQGAARRARLPICWRAAGSAPGQPAHTGGRLWCRLGP